LQEIKAECRVASLSIRHPALQSMRGRVLVVR